MRIRAMSGSSGGGGTSVNGFEILITSPITSDTYTTNAYVTALTLSNFTEAKTFAIQQQYSYNGWQPVGYPIRVIADGTTVLDASGGSGNVTIPIGTQEVQFQGHGGPYGYSCRLQVSFS